MLQFSSSGLEAKRPIRDYLMILCFIVVLAFYGYHRYNQPPEMPNPLMVGIDDVEYSDSLFNGDYDFSDFAHKRVEIFYPVNYDEFSKSSDETITEYTSSSISEAWSKLSMECPGVVTGLAEWLCNGTLAEAGLRYYGDLHTFRTWASEEHITASIRGEDERLLCEFSIYRGEYFAYDDVLTDSVYDTSAEYVVIEKTYQKLDGQGLVWAYCVFLENDTQIRSALIQYKKN